MLMALQDTLYKYFGRDVFGVLLLDALEHMVTNACAHDTALLNRDHVRDD